MLLDSETVRIALVPPVPTPMIERCEYLDALLYGAGTKERHTICVADHGYKLGVGGELESTQRECLF